MNDGTMTPVVYVLLSGKNQLSTALVCVLCKGLSAMWRFLDLLRPGTNTSSIQSSVVGQLDVRVLTFSFSWYNGALDIHLHSIHIMNDGTMTPVVYVLLSGKNQLFNLLHEHMPFNPTKAFADFKAAVHNAIRLVKGTGINSPITVEYVGC
jgi:hypothetical protein